VRLTTLLRVAVLSGLLAVFQPFQGVAPAQGPRAQAKGIQGNWKVVSVEMDGKKDPDGEVFDMIRNATMTFTKDKQIIEVGGGKKVYTYTLDPKHKPQALYLKGDVSVAAVYKLDGNTLKICMPNAGKGGGVMPTALTTKKGDGRLLIVLKRGVK